MSDTYRFRLKIQGPGMEQVLAIPQGTVWLGRQPGCSLFLNDSQVSRQHARIDCAGNSLQITDLGSSNFTWVDGEKIPAHTAVPLHPGAQIRVGPFTLFVEQEESQPALIQGPAEVQRPVEARTTLKKKPAVPPPAPPLPPVLPPVEQPAFDPAQPPPGLTYRGEKLLSYLPGIYQDDFTARFLGIFEAIFLPIEWQIEHFDLYLDPATCPAGFLPWLAAWYHLSLDESWDELQKRTILKEAHKIYARRGTRWALNRLLEIYTAQKVEITELAEDLPAHMFRVKASLPLHATREQLERLIAINKPAHTQFRLEITEGDHE
jgi:phage tail-like protein